ncbi:DUF6252 family protein [Solitalea lacus]|uniref:DUF6252 family protein n=1 Tax=Solitalea lacus TaxID=2911172 RepID=UPI001EDB658C|nr:DUF6252 family protein [Solitalea lacus]UKJ07136.1 DUF6252 family protein [Solitalea lacus]
MKNNFNKIVWLVVLIIFFYACKDFDGTREKEFGCKVNGQKWNPFSDDFKFNPVEAHSYIYSGRRIFYIDGYNSPSNIKIVGFFISDLTTAKDYPLTLSPSNNVGSIKIGDNEYKTDNVNIGTVSIYKLDTVHQKISGVFSFKAKMVDGNITANVTEGYFDVKYKPY